MESSCYGLFNDPIITLIIWGSLKVISDKICAISFHLNSVPSELVWYTRLVYHIFCSRHFSFLIPWPIFYVAHVADTTCPRRPPVSCLPNMSYDMSSNVAATCRDVAPVEIAPKTWHVVTSCAALSPLHCSTCNFTSVKYNPSLDSTFNSRDP